MLILLGFLKYLFMYLFIIATQFDVGGKMSEK